MATIRDYLHRKANVLRTNGPNIFIECPGCKTRKAKCSIHVHKAIGNCFRASCSLNGGFNFPKLITYLEKVSYSEALSIASRYNEEVEREYQAKSFGTNRAYPTNSLPIQELLNLAEYKGDKKLFYLAQHGIEYLIQKRDLTLEQIQDYQLGVGYADYEGGYIEEPTKLVPRYGMIIIPIFFNQEIVSYTSRSMEYFGTMLGEVKHHHPEEFENYLSTGQILFNCDVAIPQSKDRGYLIIVEDAWSAIKLGAVATLGSNLSDDQIYILVNNWRGPIVICRDNDVGGRKAATKDAEKLSKFYSDIRIVEPVGVDPDDNLEATKKLIEEALPIDLFQRRLGLLLK